jgi:hypothetical protein
MADGPDRRVIRPGCNTAGDVLRERALHLLGHKGTISNTHRLGAVPKSQWSVAEGVRFELTDGLHHRRFSRPVP